jgi:hypothetical protein
MREIRGMAPPRMARRPIMAQARPGQQGRAGLLNTHI